MPDKSNSVTFFALNTAKMGSSLRGSLLSSVININLLARSVFRVKEMPNCLIAACKISAASTPSVSPPSHSLSSLFFLSFFLKPPPPPPPDTGHCQMLLCSAVGPGWCFSSEAFFQQSVIAGGRTRCQRVEVASYGTATQEKVGGTHERDVLTRCNVGSLRHRSRGRENITRSTHIQTPCWNIDKDAFEKKSLVYYGAYYVM